MAMYPLQDAHAQDDMVEDCSLGPCTVVAEEDTSGIDTTVPTGSLTDKPDDKTVTVVKQKGIFRLPADSRLVNNLYRATGFLELANAGDFAANIWNDEPVPVYATVFMAVGGTVAGVLSVYAFFDAWLAWNNVRFLRRQRRALRDEQTRRLEASQPTDDIDVLLAISFRELGSEAINRWGMDICMGGGAVLISIGTYMAIGGADHRVWIASNILSGYLGNAPIALYGLFNCLWAGYLWAKAQGHVNAAAQVMSGTREMALLKRRCRNVQAYCTINGTATMLGGVGSMLTATRWWAYVILIPVIISSFFCNIWWRKRVGYTRPFACSIPNMNVDNLSAKLEFAARAELRIGRKRMAPLDQLMADSTSLAAVLSFLSEHALIEELCVRIISDVHLGGLLCNTADSEVNLSVSDILALPESVHPALLKCAQECVHDAGQEHFKYQERYAAELLGTFLSECNAKASEVAEKA